MRAALLLAAVALVAGCAGEQPEDDPRTPGSSAASADAPSPSRSSDARDAPDRPRGPAYSDWEVGADPLPLRPDGYGEMRPTPRALRERRLPTDDVLPPPAGGRWASTIAPITPAIRDRMGETWSPECPVALDGLRYLTVAFRGFDGRAHTGELVVAASEAEGVVEVFRRLFRAGFPIEEMRLPTTADLDAPPTGDGNGTAGLVCRAARGLSTWSAHAYGLAIDLNPFMNPYQRDDVVLPELASAYLDRSWVRPGMVGPGTGPGEVAVAAFADIGWSWGGDWTTLKDYQHFTATGR